MADSPRMSDKSDVCAYTAILAASQTAITLANSSAGA
jgi:hypothetical protein